MIVWCSQTASHIKLRYPRREGFRVLDHVLKEVMQQKGSYIKDSGAFIKKLKEIKEVANDAVMVTVDVFRLYLYDVGLEALRKTIDERVNKKMVLRILLKWQNLFWKITTLKLMVNLNNSFLASSIGTKFASPYSCIFMDKPETEFLES